MIVALENNYHSLKPSQDKLLFWPFVHADLKHRFVQTVFNGRMHRYLTFKAWDNIRNLGKGKSKFLLVVKNATIVSGALFTLRRKSIMTVFYPCRTKLAIYNEWRWRGKFLDLWFLCKRENRQTPDMRAPLRKWRNNFFFVIDIIFYLWKDFK